MGQEPSRAKSVGSALDRLGQPAHEEQTEEEAEDARLDNERFRALSTGSQLEARRYGSVDGIRQSSVDALRAAGGSLKVHPPAAPLGGVGGVGLALGGSRERSRSCSHIAASTVAKQRRLFDAAVLAQHRAAEAKADESDSLLGGSAHLVDADKDPALRRFAARYEALEPLGSGTYSFVRKVRRVSDGAEFAMKVVSKAGMTPGLLHQTRLEVKFMRMLRHKNILRLEEALETPEYILMVLELVQAGSLLESVAKANSSQHYSEFVAARYVEQLLEALTAVHALNVVHMDLKPDNVLLGADGTVKLCDFGLAGFAPVERDFAVPMFVSPETLERGECDTQADMWAVGVLTYILLCGFAPFIGPREGPECLSNQIKSVNYDFFSPYWDHVSDQAKDFVAACLRHEPSERPTAEEALQLPWLTTASATALPGALQMRLGEFDARKEFHNRLTRLKLALRFQHLLEEKVREHEGNLTEELRAIF